MELLLGVPDQRRQFTKLNKRDFINLGEVSWYTVLNALAKPQGNKDTSCLHYNTDNNYPQIITIPTDNNYPQTLLRQIFYLYMRFFKMEMTLPDIKDYVGD